MIRGKINWTTASSLQRCFVGYSEQGEAAHLPFSNHSVQSFFVLQRLGNLLWGIVRSFK